MTPAASSPANAAASLSQSVTAGQVFSASLCAANARSISCLTHASSSLVTSAGSKHSSSTVSAISSGGQKPETTRWRTWICAYSRSIDIPVLSFGGGAAHLLVQEADGGGGGGGALRRRGANAR